LERSKRKNEKAKSGYSNRNKSILPQRKGLVNEMTKTATQSKTESTREAGTFTRRIGFTTYRVGVHFSNTSRETANDKIARLVRIEADIKAVNQ